MWQVLADKYIYYTMEVNRQKLNNNESLENIKYLDKNTTKKSVEGEVLDKLGLTKYCCRRIMLTHVDIE